MLRIRKQLLVLRVLLSITVAAVLGSSLAEARPGGSTTERRTRAPMMTVESGEPDGGSTGKSSTTDPKNSQTNVGVVVKVLQVAGRLWMARTLGTQL